MSLLLSLPEIVEESRKIFNDFMNGDEKSPEFSCEARFGEEPEGTVAHGDNIQFMKYLIRERNMSGKIQMIYIDPPFFSKAKYEAIIEIGGQKVRPMAYNDIWEKGMEEYLKMFCVRALFMKELLAEEGSIWVHLDWHVVHYIKILMDEIFGQENFINEVIWTYKSGGASKKSFAHKHDNILFYGKSKKYYFVPQKEKSYNRGLKPYHFKGVEEFCDEVGWYTMVNRKDVWQIDMVGRTSKERTGYATQKPLALVERIMESCTREGDTCADFFAGSGVVAKAAVGKGRKFVSCDSGALACGEQVSGLMKAGGKFELLSNEESCAGEFELGFEVLNTENGKCLSAELCGYNADLSKVSLSQDDRIKAEEADWQDLIESWSIDLNYDGICHRPDVVFARKGREIETATLQEISPDSKAVSVMTCDVFGHRTIKEFNLK